MIGPVATRPDGRFNTRLPDRQPSGTLKLYHLPSSGGNEHVASGDVRLRIRAGVFLSAKRSNSRRVAFRGHVLTGTANKTKTSPSDRARPPRNRGAALPFSAPAQGVQRGR